MDGSLKGGSEAVANGQGYSSLSGVSPGISPGASAIRRQSFREAEAAREQLRRRVRQERLILFPILILALLAWPNFGIAKVVGHSMEPTYHTGNTLILLKTYRALAPLKVGDVIVVRLKHGPLAGSDIVKRVAFVQNDTATASFPTWLHAGKRVVSFSFLFPEVASREITVPRNQIEVLGDNLMNSDDSRDFGPVADYEILGKVLFP